MGDKALFYKILSLVAMFKAFSLNKDIKCIIQADLQCMANFNISCEITVDRISSKARFALKFTLKINKKVILFFKVSAIKIFFIIFYLK